MLQDLVLLVQLQEIDLRIKEQELAQENFPAQVNQLEQGITKARAALDHSNEKLQKALTEKSAFEEQIQKAKDGLDKSQDRLNNIKTNREYDAVHAEIETQKNMVNNGETRKKNIQDEIEKLQSSVTEAQGAYDAMLAENEPKIKELKEKIAAIDSTIAEITKERDVLVPQIGKHILRPYDLIRKKRKNGKALSLISNNRHCSVCFKVLEPQLYNEIKRGLKLIICESCGSIMVWNGEFTSKN
ncbi:MAG TPA: C4-type zinc ribbon domain-containing protein [Chitinispirillaceae bacterium]|nr:C4-type zinc ribbon domain-containing protein [Chitinispirillaceae bacterium]